MLLFLIVSVLLSDGSRWDTQIQFYSAEDCKVEGEAFDAFMASHGELWISYHAACESEPAEEEFAKRET